MQWEGLKVVMYVQSSSSFSNDLYFLNAPPVPSAAQHDLMAALSARDGVKTPTRGW